MKVIGVTGGIASGKSLVTRQFGRLGAVILDADRVGHAVLRDASVRAAVRDRWGDAVIGPDGQVDRVAVSRRVFALSPEGAAALEFLERLTHPLIGARIRRRIERMARRGAAPVAILDAPVLFKARWDAYCDSIVFVEAPRQVRLARALERGWTESQFAAREAAQLPIDQKRRRSSVVIDNSGSLGRTVAQIEAFWRTLTR